MIKSMMKVWALCGVLDAAYATGLTLLDGKQPIAQMWRGVATGPFGSDALDWGLGGALLGLAVHFLLMGVMVLAYFYVAQRSRALREHPWIAGGLYGVTLYLVMHGLVLPLRFGAPCPPHEFVRLMRPLFAHVVLVGWPIAFFARAGVRDRHVQ